MYGGRPAQANGQDHQEGTFAYEAAFQANFAAVPHQHHTYHNQQQTAFVNDQWVTTTGLPDDDDPLLQRRLQQLVEHHKPSRNVLRELADVAEQQTPSGTKRKAFDDEIGSEDEDDEPRRTSNKQRKSVQSTAISRARKQMDDTIFKRNTLRQAINTLAAQLKNLQQQYEEEKNHLASADLLVQETSEQLLDELLEDPSPWNQMYYHLVEFHNRHGHLRVPWRKEDKEKEPITSRLGPWLVQQRKDYRRDVDDPERLEPYKIAALEKLQIEWEPFRQHWFNRFEALKAYKAEHGHCRVPYCSGRSQRKKSKAEEDEEMEEEENENVKVRYDSLGVWVKRQRNQYKNFTAGNKEKAGEMTDERIQLLEDLGFEWSLRAGPEPVSWMESYSKLKEHKEQHGNTRVDEKQNKQLAEWVKQMRSYLKKYDEDITDNALTDEQYRLLKEIELDSSLRESKFGARFSELMEFKENHGHCIVPASYAANQKLSNWVQTQKRQYKLMKDGKKSQMTEEKYNILVNAGFEFEVSKERKTQAMKSMDRSWEELYAELVQYKEKYGQVNSIKQRKKKALREWCDEQRVQHARMKWGKESAITEAQIDKLTELGFAWTVVDTPSKGWDDYYGDLLTLYIKKSSFKIPDEEEELKHWVETQKVEYQKFVRGVPSLLTQSRIKKLNDVSFPFDGVDLSPETQPPARSSWEEMFGRLLKFRIQHNHFDVPQSMKDLHDWTRKQRQEKIEQTNRKSMKNRSAIWEERVRRLTEVGFDWEGQLPEREIEQVRAALSTAMLNLSHNTTQTSANAIPMLTPMGSRLPPMAFMGAWAGAAAMQQVPHGSNLLIAPNAMLPPSTIPAGKSLARDLANQAARIVVDTNNRRAAESIVRDSKSIAETQATPQSDPIIL